MRGRWLRHGPDDAPAWPLREPPPDSRWQRGKTVDALYLADSEATIREHAKLSGFPANTITEVRSVIDPMTAVIGYMLFKSFGVVLYNVSQVSFRQRLCPRPMLGRMNASIRFLVWGVMPIGAFLGGVIGHNYGLRSVFWIEAFGAILAGAIRCGPGVVRVLGL